MSSSRVPSVLIVDDETGILESLGILLRNAGFATHTARGGRAGLEQLSALQPDSGLSDVRMPDVGGVEILAAAKQQDPDTPVILMTAQATLQSAMQAVNEGAFYYIQKPFRNDELLAILKRAAEHRELRVENRSLKQEIKRREGPAGSRPVGNSRSWLDVLRLAETVAPTESTVLIQGESGTGKELVARALHSEGARAKLPFVAINCGAIPEELMESELFGHRRGSFTGAVADKLGLFQEADGGTMFLDEIGELSLGLQVKLLRALQERKVKQVGAAEELEVDVRVIAATNRDLETEVARGAFRADLYYRLNVIELRLPPLRHRREDIPLLAEHFLRRFSAEHGRASKLSTEALRRLESYEFPGNVRELENIIERAVALSSSALIGASDLPEVKAPKITTPQPPSVLPSEGVDLDQLVSDYERTWVLRALEQTGGVRKRAATLLGISFRSLRYRLEKLGIEKGDDEEPAE